MPENHNEREAVRTTIVGGRPPGSGRNNVAVPRGIEVLLKKAAIDPDFRQLLLEQRDGAAGAIGLSLEPAEQAMLSTIQAEHLKLIVSQTKVPVEQRRVFLGQVAAAMLATLSTGLAGCERVASAGVRPVTPPGTDGIRPDRPGSTNAPVSPPSTPQALSAGISAARPISQPPPTNTPITTNDVYEMMRQLFNRGNRPDHP